MTPQQQTDILLSHFPWLTQQDIADYWADRYESDREQKEPRP